MRMTTKLRFAAVAVVVGAIAASVAAAAPIGPVQPGVAPLAGVSFVPSGDMGLGGLQYAFSGVPTVPSAQFQTLEWGPRDATAVKVGLDGGAHVLTFAPGASNLAAGLAVWTGSSPYTFIDPVFGTPVPIVVQTRVRFSTPGLAWQTTSGYGGGASVPVSGNFTPTIFFDVSDDNGTSWTPAKVFYNAHNNVGVDTNLVTDVGEGFFYTPANAPVASLDATSFDYGAVPVGTTSPAHTFTLSNIGNANLNVSSVASSGAFTITADTCSGSSVAQGGSCTIDATFSPTTGGPTNGSITITDNASGSPRTISLHGFGQQPSIQVSPSSLTFTPIGVGSTSSVQTVGVTNNGDAPLSVTSVTFAGGSSGDFTVTPGTCGALPFALGQGAACLLNVTFSPSAGGPRSTTMQISSNDPVTPTSSVPLTGTGLVSHFALSPNPLAYGNVLTGQSKTLTLTLSNSGADPASLTGPPTTSGPNPADFAPIVASLTCPTPGGGPPVVPAHGSCTVDFTFTPGGVGPRSATFTFPNDSLDGAQSVTMTGTGIQPVASLTVPSSADFGTLNPGQSSMRTISLTSSGTIPVAVSAASLSGADYAVVSDGCSGLSLTPGSSCSVTLKYTASATPGPSNGTLTVTSNGVGSPQSVALSGASTPQADLNVSIGAGEKFVKPNGTLTYTITVLNAGPGAAPATTVVDALPSGEVFTKLVAPAAGSCTTPAVGASGTVKCNVGTLASGASVSLVLTVKVTTRKGTVTNGASATSGAPDPDPADNQASVTTPVK